MKLETFLCFTRNPSSKHGKLNKSNENLILSYKELYNFSLMITLYKQSLTDLIILTHIDLILITFISSARSEMFKFEL